MDLSRINCVQGFHYIVMTNTYSNGRIGICYYSVNGKRRLYPSSGYQCGKGYYSKLGLCSSKYDLIDIKVNTQTFNISDKFIGLLSELNESHTGYKKRMGLTGFFFVP